MFNTMKSLRLTPSLITITRTTGMDTLTTMVMAMVIIMDMVTIAIMASRMVPTVRNINTGLTPMPTRRSGTVSSTSPDRECKPCHLKPMPC